MRPYRHPPNHQTIAELWAYGHCFAGLCKSCPEVRDVQADRPRLIERLGPDSLVTEAARRIRDTKTRLAREDDKKSPAGAGLRWSEREAP